MTTPLFPAFRARLAALGRRAAAPLRQGTLQQLARHLAGLIPVPLLSSADEGPNSRERLFTLRLTCECFLWQMLKPDTACREVVRQVQALACWQGGRSVDESASAYIQARQRLPQDRLERILAATAQAAGQRAAASTGLQGRAVKVVDGSSVQLPDTAANQKEYPQPSGQKPGCGFPVLKLGVLFSLASGALLDVVMGNLHHHDLRLFHPVSRPGTSCWATAPTAITSRWRVCPGRAWTWWPACIRRARWIFARPSGWATRMACSPGPRGACNPRF